MSTSIAMCGAIFEYDFIFTVVITTFQKILKSYKMLPVFRTVISRKLSCLFSFSNSVLYCQKQTTEVFCYKRLLLEISKNSQGNICARDSFLIKLQGNFIKKESLAQLFSCEFCKISKSTFSYRTPPGDWSCLVFMVIDCSGYLKTVLVVLFFQILHDWHQQIF